jgi:hypothetical protein
MKLVGGWPGRIVIGKNGRFGVRPDEFSTDGDFDVPIENDVDPGDESTEIAWVITELPSDGTITANDDGGFAHVDADDGTYTTTYRLYTWAPGGPVADEGEGEVQTSFGDGVTAPGVTLTATASLITGSASGQSNVTADGTTLTATASLLTGSATGSSSATADGVTLTATASFIEGSASGETNATAEGATLTATASLIPGSAEGTEASTAPGATLTASASLIPGSASGESNVEAPGVTLTATASLVAGAASGSTAGSCDPAEIWGFVLPNGKTAAETLVENNEMLLALSKIHGLVIGTPLVVEATQRTAGDIEQTISESNGVVTVERIA